MCKSQAEGGRCATHTRQGLAHAHTRFVGSTLEAHTAEMAMSARVDALATELGLPDFSQVPDHVYDTDPELAQLCAVTRDADEDMRSAKRALDAAYVDHAATPTGHKEISDQVLSAKDRGRAQTAAYLIGILHQADDMVAARARYSVRQPQLA